MDCLRSKPGCLFSQSNRSHVRSQPTHSSWEARYIKGHDLSGKIRYGFCYGKTYKEAKEKVTQVKESTYVKYETTLEKHIKPRL